MGIGMVIIVRPDEANTALATLRKAGEKPIIVGRIEKGTGISRLIN
jgi:phosphoribosylaminoimidazole (AIR) synthetase